MKLNIAYSCDEAYISHTGISIVSLLENNKEFEEIDFYFVAKDVSQKSLDLLKKLVNSYGRNLIVVSFYDICGDLKIKALGRHIETVYAKLFFARIKEIDKVLYIDSDTIINDSLKEFWETDLTNDLIGGVETYTVDAKKLLNLSKSDKFINDGVALINLKEFRKQNIETKFIECIAEYNGNPPVLSEGVINKVCKGKIKVLHPKFNLMSGLITYKKNRFLNITNYYSKTVIKEAIDKPVIIHYLSAFYNRPWDKNCTHPMKEKYLYYKSISYWKDEPLQSKKMIFRLRVIKFLYDYFPNIILDFIRFIIKKKRIFKY
ncbi:MAG: glycosyltransferase family 8 protein [Lutibacter sp.]|uniref:glycosyltransferase family 8 protein n=1 Tax=Lutibacter sp. TaxID=1925666 RepID=UPI00299F4F06|nr:glycosyltransferase family 8 protein [Lutibacter sp.]MDX1828784.1 glycosyltransferase family 8 protein [Lutibacter sp.]